MPLLLALTALLGCLLAPLAGAQSVALSGILGTKALIVVDDNAPKSIAIGETYLGVKLLSTSAEQAQIDVGGVRQTLRLGEAPVSVKTRGGGSSQGRIVMQAGSGGHFHSAGQINGRAAQMLVDTGASVVSMGAADAERMGLNYKTGQAVRMNTANGSTIGWQLKLNSVRVGEVEVFDVDAVVMPVAMPYVLLGNSFLTRFQMARTNDQLVLEKRY